MSQDKEEPSLKTKFSVAYFPKIKDLYPWQAQVVEICQRAPTLQCHWYWGPIIGKTAMTRYLIENHNAFLAYPLASQIRAVVKNPACYILVINPPYAQSKRIPYDEISNVIDGAIMHIKKEVLLRDPIHVFVFSNHPPEREKMPERKWHIQNIQTIDQVPAPPPPLV